jgi:dihydropteroate synthase
MGESRPLIFGILNVTPDSFSDGGKHLGTGAALHHAYALNAAGADIIDLGGESTRPGAERVPEAEEHARVLPVVEALVAAGIDVSIDTMRASTAELAVGAGAVIINDVSGGLADPEMFAVVSRTNADYILMHWRGLDHEPALTSAVSDVRSDLKARIAELVVWGIDPARVILDPGLGFGKTAADNWALLGHLPELATLGHRVLVGASRKRFLAPFAAEGAPASDRDDATATISALAAQSGAWAVRVHDVAATKATLDVWQAWNEGARA